MSRRNPALIAVLLLVAGCSQVTQLAPVASEVTTVRAAAIDILIDQRIDIMTAPKCTETGKDIDCVGATFGQETITVTFRPASVSELTVTVGSTTLYTGTAEAVLDKAAQALPT